MGLHEELDGRLKAAMKAKDKPVLDVIRMIRSRAKKEATTASKALDDGLYLETIQSYVKQMRRALVEFEAAGDSGAELADQLRFEVAYLEPLLPGMLGEDELRGLVSALIASQGVTDPRQAGRVVGMVMKEHKGQAEPAMVKRIAEELLAG